MSRGFTLIEMMYSLVVLDICMLGVVGMQVSAGTGQQTSIDITIATSIAGSVLEEARIVPLATASVAGTYYFDRTGLDSLSPSYFTAVRTPTMDPTLNYISLDVTVSWKAKPTDTNIHSISLDGARTYPLGATP